MGFDEQLAGRIRQLLADRGEDVTEKRMFGGLCFLVDGGMCCGVLQDTLFVRVGAGARDAALARPHTRVFDFSGRVSKTMVTVAAEGTRGEGVLEAWVDRGLVGKG